MSLSRMFLAALAALSATAAPLAVQSAEPAACQTVRFADVGWSDISSTTGMASVVLEGLGYKPVVTIASMPITFAGLKAKQLDVFLGYWSPSTTPMIEPFVKAGQIKVLDHPNLTGAKYTLAVPDYLYDKGLKSFADIAKFRKELDGKIIGIEPGNDGNRLVQHMIDKDQFGLKGFKVIESSEAGMLAEVQRDVRSQKAVVFLGWEPHPMNVKMKMRYLEGGDDVFGPNYGEAKVYTVVPPDYEARCPNVGQLINNLTFTPAMENELMIGVMDKKKPADVARAWIKKNPSMLDGWLKGVKTFSGGDGLASVKKSLGL